MSIPNLIVPVLNRYDLLYKMVESIDYPVDRLLIIENGGGQTLPDRYQTSYINDVDVVTLPSNLGVAGSWNLGVKLLPHDRVWFFTSNDVTFLPGGLANLAKAKPGELMLSLDAPHWHTFALGEDIVRRVGLFDERLYPAYFEDNDYINRVQIEGLGDAVTLQDIPSTHQNSSTLASSPVFQERNRHTFLANQKLYHQKIARADRSWSWDLDRRRAGEWLVD
jgi:GT2 family glycosyltransferase